MIYEVITDNYCHVKHRPEYQTLSMTILRTKELNNTATQMCDVR